VEFQLQKPCLKMQLLKLLSIMFSSWSSFLVK